METVILLLFFLLSDNNKKNDLKDSLNRFLCFYKENRELLRMLISTFSSPAPAASGASEEECGREESRPREEVGNASILEEVLRRVNA